MELREIIINLQDEQNRKDAVSHQEALQKAQEEAARLKAFARTQVAKYAPLLHLPGSDAALDMIMLTRTFPANPAYPASTSSCWSALCFDVFNLFNNSIESGVCCADMLRTARGVACHSEPHNAACAGWRI